jgi:hypothetical protein
MSLSEIPPLLSPLSTSELADHLSFLDLDFCLLDLPTMSSFPSSRPDCIVMPPGKTSSTFPTEDDALCNELWNPVAAFARAIFPSVDYVLSLEDLTTAAAQFTDKIEVSL